MKHKWLYIGLIFSIMMALVPVSALAYTNTPHNWGIPRPKNETVPDAGKLYTDLLQKKWRFLFRGIRRKKIFI